MMTISELEENIRESKFFEELEPGTFIMTVREPSKDEDTLPGIDLLLGSPCYYRLDKIPQFAGYGLYLFPKEDSKVLIQWE